MKFYVSDLLCEKIKKYVPIVNADASVHTFLVVVNSYLICKIECKVAVTSSNV